MTTRGLEDECRAVRESRLWFQPMPVFKKLITVVSVGVLGLFAIHVVSTPFLREPPTPVVNVTIEPQPPVETTEPLPETTGETREPARETTDGTTRGYQTGQRTGEHLNHLWAETKDFTRGLWSTITEKE